MKLDMINALVDSVYTRKVTEFNNKQQSYDRDVESIEVDIDRKAEQLSYYSDYLKQIGTLLQITDESGKIVNLDKKIMVYNQDSSDTKQYVYTEGFNEYIDGYKVKVNKLARRAEVLFYGDNDQSLKKIGIDNKPLKIQGQIILTLNAKKIEISIDSQDGSNSIFTKVANAIKSNTNSFGCEYIYDKFNDRSFIKIFSKNTGADQTIKVSFNFNQDEHDQNNGTIKSTFSDCQGSNAEIAVLSSNNSENDYCITSFNNSFKDIFPGVDLTVKNQNTEGQYQTLEVTRDLKNKYEIANAEQKLNQLINEDFAIKNLDFYNLNIINQFLLFMREDFNHTFDLLKNSSNIYNRNLKVKNDYNNNNIGKIDNITYSGNINISGLKLQVRHNNNDVVIKAIFCGEEFTALYDNETSKVIFNGLLSDLSFDYSYNADAINGTNFTNFTNLFYLEDDNSLFSGLSTHIQLLRKSYDSINDFIKNTQNESYLLTKKKDDIRKLQDMDNRKHLNEQEKLKLAKLKADFSINSAHDLAKNILGKKI